MKRLVKWIALTAIPLLVLAACSVFVFGVNDLKGKKLTYYFFFAGDSSPNGHDNTVLVFDNTGASGSFESQEFTWDYATAAAYAASDYTQKTWYQNFGYRGTFTYNAETGVLHTVISDIYGPNATATPIYGSLYASSDYAYQTTDAYYTRQSGTAVTGSSLTMDAVYQINADSLLLIYTPGATSSTWVNESKTTESRTQAGVASTTEKAYTRAYTVQDGSLVYHYSWVETQTVGTTVTPQTYDATTTNTISKAFIVGEEDREGVTFANVWKEGNAVTFLCTQTQKDLLYYGGTTAPTAPTVGTDGFGSTGSWGTDYYEIDRRQESNSYELTHGKGYILESNDADFAARGTAAE